MKQVFIVLIIAAIFSCKYNLNTVDKGVSKLVSELTISDNPDIYGDWKMCSADLNGCFLNCNVCRNISFNLNGTCNVGDDSFRYETYNWNLKNGILKLYYYGNNSNSTFSDTTYSILDSMKDGIFMLTIRCNKSNSVYYLSKK